MTTETYDSLNTSLNNSFYNTHAVDLTEQYLSKSFEEVHASWIDHLPSILNQATSEQLTTHSSTNASTNPSATLSSANSSNNSLVRILDIGAGAGRDAKYLAEQGNATQPVEVYAVEPAQTLANLGKQTTSNLNVKWFQDSLPALDTVSRQEVRFDLILLSAVWMHITPEDRSASLSSLKELLTPNGKIIITLRHGKSGDARIMHQVSIEELQALSCHIGLSIIEHTELEQDKLGRNQVQWQTTILALSEALDITEKQASNEA